MRRDDFAKILFSMGIEEASGIPKRSKDPGKIRLLNDIEMALKQSKEVDPHSHEKEPVGRTNKHIKSRHKVRNDTELSDFESEIEYDRRLSMNTTSTTAGSHEELDHETDFEDNLTFSSTGEDSLSVIVGNVQMPAGQTVKVWIVSDSGSMTQLIQKQYAGEQGFKAVALAPHQRFSISSPGGGEDHITHVVTLEVRLQMRKYLKVVEDYEKQVFETELSEPVETIVRMSFGVCENLPVPILWGGKQMRKYELLDHQSERIISMKFGPLERWQMPSISWLVACAEMRDVIKDKRYKALKPFVPLSRANGAVSNRCCARDH